jgi:uncharacterized zinc-type alcohol dehydrogenase-like protein
MSDPEANEVLINITHCGLCYSDYCVWSGLFGKSLFPRAVGHEIVGIVEATGADVSHLTIGQRVGMGWQGGSCGECEWCEGGHENVCAKRRATCVHDNGGFAQYKMADSRFVVPVPEQLQSDIAAPLFCAGATVYSPLVRHASGSRKKVAVAGVGGLGHLALQFARAFGHEVTAISSSSDKREEALGFGADSFYLTDQLQALKSSFDLILITNNASGDWAPYLDTLRPHGTLCFLCIDAKPIDISPLQLVAGERQICGSAVAGTTMMADMLAFAAKHQIKPQVEVMPMSDINRAFERLSEGAARYRIVLRNDSSAG